MNRIFVSPGKYIQGPNAILELGEQVNHLGHHALLVVTEDDFERLHPLLEKAHQRTAFKFTVTYFKPPCTDQEIERLVALKQKPNDIVIGLGGGQTLDTAKAVANALHCPVITIPTIASTDAPCSSISVIYQDGYMQGYKYYRRSPDLVLVDSQIIANAPTRFLIAGMGDALSTFFEARACLGSNATTPIKGKATQLAFLTAQACYQILLENALAAIDAANNNTVTDALENIIEANTLLSGIGFESAGLAAAHAIHNGLIKLEQTQPFMHGEIVAFATICQLVLEQAPREEITQVISFCRSTQLPTQLQDIGLKNITNEQLQRVAEYACGPNETIHNLPSKITQADVIAAIVKTDTYL